jgi:hypothetical protein
MLKNIISNRILLFAILLISFFGMNLGKVNSQVYCDPGFTPGSTVVIIGGCTYNFNFCYKCGPTGNQWGGTQYYIRDYSPLGPCSNPLPTTQQIVDAFKNQQMKNFCTYQPCCEEWENCTVRIEVLAPLCIRKRNIAGVIGIEECPGNTSYCRERAEVCIGPDGNLVFITTAGYYDIIGGSPSCPTEVEPDPGYNRVSNCYQAVTICTPAP